MSLKGSTAFILVMLGMAAGTSYGIQFLAAPPIYELATSQGQKETQVITVSNADSFKSVKVRVYVSDWNLKKDGAILYDKPARTDKSCAPWIEVNPAELEVAPGQMAEVRFTVTVPDSAEGSHWAVIFFESIPDSLPPKGKIGLIMSGRLGTMIYVTPGGTEKKQCEFSSLAYRRAGYQKHEFTLTLNNTGNTFIRPKGKLTIMDDKEKAIDEQPIPEEVVLPGVVRQFKFVLNKILPPGKYKIVADVDLGLREALQGETTFEVTQ